MWWNHTPPSPFSAHLQGFPGGCRESLLLGLVVAVFEYIEGFYNRQRRHSTLDYLTPEEFEKERITTTNIN